MASVNISLPVLHPYHPVGVTIPGMAFNETATPLLVAAFLSGWGLIVLAAFLTVSHLRPSLRKVDKILVLWFVLSGSVHLFFESHFVLNHATLASSQHFFSQLWKEYSLSDSRYLTSDPFVLCMEAVTIGWGPLCFLIAYQIVNNSSTRYPIQAIVSVGQLYGNVLYLATSLFDLYHNGISYCRPEGFYFWAYFVFFNFIWIIIPLFTLFQSVVETSRAFDALKKRVRISDKSKTN
ncbi:EBP domain-containing protein [Xylogone sp. PMI_703]|nr:EBP domain-containing protein [Xylogone sp. PMI_703]